MSSYPNDVYEYTAAVITVRSVESLAAAEERQSSRQAIYLSIYLPIYLFAYLSIYLSICLSISLSIYLSMALRPLWTLAAFSVS
jgi:hypothetical protein